MAEAEEDELCSSLQMAEAEEDELCSSLDVEARKELSTYTSASNPPGDCVCIVYALKKQ